MQTLKEVRGQYDFTPYEKKLFLSKSGKIRTKYRISCYKKLISDGFFTENAEFTQKGIDALQGILHPSGMSDKAKKAIMEAMR